MLQIVMNYQRKSTGELAPTTLVLQAAGNLARIFTTIVQVGRAPNISNFETESRAVDVLQMLVTAVLVSSCGAAVWVWAAGAEQSVPPEHAGGHGLQRHALLPVLPLPAKEQQGGIRQGTDLPWVGAGSTAVPAFNNARSYPAWLIFFRTAAPVSIPLSSLSQSTGCRGDVKAPNRRLPGWLVCLIHRLNDHVGPMNAYFFLARSMN